MNDMAGLVFRVLHAGAVILALSAVPLAGCSGGGGSVSPQSGGRTNSPIAAPSGSPPAGQPYAVAQLRAGAGASGGRKSSTAWNSQTVDTCFPNNACEVQTFPTSSYGVTVNCNGNTSCANSTYAPYVVGGPADVAISFSPTAVAPGSYSWSTITVSANEKPGMLSETIGFTVASGPGPNVGNLSLQTQVLCAKSILSACPKLQIVDQNLPGAPVVSGNPPTTQQTVVGRQTSLLVRAKPIGGSGTYNLTNPTWNIPGYTAKDYQLNGATPEPIGYWTDRLSPQLAFFWYLPQDNTVTVTATLTRIDNNESADLQATADYNVQMPTSSASITVHPGRENTGQRSDGNGGYFLSCGTPQNECVDFSFNVTNDAGFPGTIAMNQLITQSEAFTDAQNHVRNVTYVPPPQLDNSPLYLPGVATTATWSAYDAPGIGLTNTYVSQLRHTRSPIPSCTSLTTTVFGCRS